MYHNTYNVNTPLPRPPPYTVHLASKFHGKYNLSKEIWFTKSNLWVVFFPFTGQCCVWCSWYAQYTQCTKNTISFYQCITVFTILNSTSHFHPIKFIWHPHPKLNVTLKKTIGYVKSGLWNFPFITSLFLLFLMPSKHKMHKNLVILYWQQWMFYALMNISLF